MLSRKLFWRGPISKSKLLNGTETSFGCALISNNCHLFCIKEKIVGRDKKYREGGREGVILYKNPSPQNKQKKEKRKKKNDISKKHGKQAIRQGKLRKITKRSTSERSIV